MFPCIPDACFACDPESGIKSLNPKSAIQNPKSKIPARFAPLHVERGGCYLGMCWRSDMRICPDGRPGRLGGIVPTLSPAARIKNSTTNPPKTASPPSPSPISPEKARKTNSFVMPTFHDPQPTDQGPRTQGQGQAARLRVRRHNHGAVLHRAGLRQRLRRRLPNALLFVVQQPRPSGTGP